VGNDTTIGGVAGAAYVAYWDGAAWQKLDAGLNAVAYVVDTDNAGNIYVGGTQTGYVSKWDGTSWTSLGAPATCWALKVAPNGTIYAGMSGGGYITTWNGQSWSSLGGGGGAFSFIYGLDIDADGMAQDCAQDQSSHDGPDPPNIFLLYTHYLCMTCWRNT
jgi:hypothetical protein